MYVHLSVSLVLSPPVRIHIYIYIYIHLYTYIYIYAQCACHVHSDVPPACVLTGRNPGIVARDLGRLMEEPTCLLWQCRCTAQSLQQTDMRRSLDDLANHFPILNRFGTQYIHDLVLSVEAAFGRFCMHFFQAVGHTLHAREMVAGAHCRKWAWAIRWIVFVLPVIDATYNTCIYLSIYLPIYLSVELSIYLSIYLSSIYGGHGSLQARISMMVALFRQHDIVGA